MSRTKSARKKALSERYPASEPCACEICVGYCARPGWWIVEEAARALEAGYAGRMMLEMSPDRMFGVLSPAFKGNEGLFALDLYAACGCTFLSNGLCELHDTGLEPLECRHCHHDRPGAGPRCHADIEQVWNTAAGRGLVVRWSKLVGLWDQVAGLAR
jgi:hypothetical protein